MEHIIKQINQIIREAYDYGGVVYGSYVHNTLPRGRFPRKLMVDEPIKLWFDDEGDVTKFMESISSELQTDKTFLVRIYVQQHVWEQVFMIVVAPDLPKGAFNIDRLMATIDIDGNPKFFTDRREASWLNYLAQEERSRMIADSNPLITALYDRVIIINPDFCSLILTADKSHHHRLRHRLENYVQLGWTIKYPSGSILCSSFTSLIETMNAIRDIATSTSTTTPTSASETDPSTTTTSPIKTAPTKITSAIETVLLIKTDPSTASSEKVESSITSTTTASSEKVESSITSTTTASSSSIEKVNTSIVRMTSAQVALDQHCEGMVTILKTHPPASRRLILELLLQKFDFNA